MDWDSCMYIHFLKDIQLKRYMKVLAGMRKGSHGSGTLALPGGHLEMFESWEECAVREVKEETNLDIHKIKLVHVTNDPMPNEGKHYVTVFVRGECIDPATAKPQNMEPHKCEGWKSYSLQELEEFLSATTPSDPRLFGPLKRLVEEQPPALKVLFSLDN
mmetsp:Transcript_28155/g.43344  ORF Transcript_28155/g.43344 Transcript_28155/m.43344 type:complete len:160 (+) Transcript_28155:296-775(+)